MCEDRDHLSVVLMGPETFEWICITSPESASVFLESWTAAGRPHVRVAAVGKATGEVLEAGGISVGFVPSKVRIDPLGDAVYYYGWINHHLLWERRRISCDEQEMLELVAF